MSARTDIETETATAKPARSSRGPAVFKQWRFWTRLAAVAAVLIGLWLWTAAVHNQGLAEGRGQAAPTELVVDQATVNGKCVTVIGVVPGGSWWALPAGATAGYPERVSSKDVGVNGCRAAPAPR